MHNCSLSTKIHKLGFSFLVNLFDNMVIILNFEITPYISLFELILFSLSLNQIFESSRGLFVLSLFDESTGFSLNEILDQFRSSFSFAESNSVT